MQQLPEKVKGRFVNPHARAIRRSLWDVFLWKMGFYDNGEKNSFAPCDFSYPLPVDLIDPEKPQATWINHSSFLVKAFGLTFITDPIFSKRCSPFSFLGPKRNHPPGLSLEELENVDCVLISHNHYDHLDKKAILKIHSRFPSAKWVVPFGVGTWFLRNGISNVFEMSWWQDLSLVFVNTSLKVHITATPAQHFSGRSLRDYNKTLWMGIVVELEKDGVEKRFYFAGDTGYNPYDFKSIGSRWGYFDLSLIPIGCYSPKVFMSPVHIDPLEAVWIHKEVGSVQSIGMHWKTFTLSDEGNCRPPYDLYLALQQEGIDPLKFLAVPPGYAVNW